MFNWFMNIIEVGSNVGERIKKLKFPPENISLATPPLGGGN